MPAPRVRVVLRLPATDEVAALGLSAAAHLVLLLLVLAAGSRATISGPPRPVVSVRLAAAPRAAPAAPRPSARRAPRPAAATPKPAAKPAKKPPRRRKARAPENVAQAPPEASAQPRELPEAEEPPPEPAANPGAEEAGAPPETPLPEAPIAGGVGGMETDEPFTADWYVNLVVARLQEAWRDRPVLPAGAEPRRVVVGFTIDRTGRVMGARILVPSGYTPLDLSALRAVESVGSLPPLPRSYERDRLGARFIFELVPPR